MKRCIIMLAACATGLGACQNGSDNAAVPTDNKTATGAMPEIGKGTIGEEIGKATDLSRFSEALKAAGLGKTLDGAGPYTVFAPTNAAFDKLPPGAAEGLMQPAQRAQLTQLLTAHIVPGAITAEDIGKAIDAAHGKAQLATMNGAPITATREGDAIILTDGTGGKARIVRPDALQSNGALHAVDGVMQPAG